MKGNIAIIAAVSRELKPLVSHRTARSWKRLVSDPGIEMWEYRHAEARWIAVCAGMGAARAALAFAAAEKLMPLDAVCSVGWAGALNGRLAAETVWSPVQIVDTGTGKRFRPAHWSGDVPILASTSGVADADEKWKLGATYCADLVDMEAATVARMALAKSIPFYCFKAISDGAEARLPNINPFIDECGQIRMLPFLLSIAVRPSSWSDLAKLGRHSAVAARNLAETIYDWLDERAYIRRGNGDYTE